MKVLVTSDKCPGCEETKKELNDELKKGEVKELNISETNDKTTVREFISKNGIRSVPSVQEVGTDEAKKLMDEGALK